MAQTTAAIPTIAQTNTQANPSNQTLYYSYGAVNTPYADPSGAYRTAVL